MAGAIATLAMDAGGILARKLGSVPEEDIGPAQLGRWIGYMSKGRFVHERVSAEPPLRMEKELGVAAHYLIGMALGAGYIGLLRALGRRPEIKTGLAYGTATTVFPWVRRLPRVRAGSVRFEERG